MGSMAVTDLHIRASKTAGWLLSGDTRFHAVI